MVLDRPAGSVKAKRKEGRAPVFSLKDLHNWFFSGKNLAPSLCPRLKSCAHNNANRLELLDLLFGGSPLDLFGGRDPYFPRDLDPKTRANRLTPLWNHERPSSAPGLSQLEALAGQFWQAPEGALDDLVRNLRQLTHAYPDPGQLNRLAGERLLQLCPDQEDVLDLVPTERRLALLAVMALLDEKAGGEERIWLWATGQKPSFLSSRPTIPDDVFLPGGSLYAPAEEEIDPTLLPDLLLEGTCYRYHPTHGSPLRQLLERCPEDRRFLLCGREVDGTTVSGAGKTTSLRYLFRDDCPAGWVLVYLPLAQVYAPGELDDPHNLRTYLSLHYDLDLERYRPGLHLLLDGLDELVHPAGLKRLCRDLEKLTRREDVTLVVTSKSEPDQLPSFETLLDWNQLWQLFRPCRVQPMTDRQRGIQKDLDPHLRRMLDTPFLVCLYRCAFQTPFSTAARRRLDRWGGEAQFQTPPEHAAQLFYISLIAQLVRWFESNTGQDRRSEADSFLLLHTLPAIAFQMVLNDICEGRTHPAANVTIDRDYVERMITLSLEGTWEGLELFPGYRDPAYAEQARRTLPDVLDYDHFLSGAAAGLLRARRVFDSQGRRRTEFRFSNHSLRDYLASLHIANIFLLAHADRLPDRDELLPFYSCTLEYIPADFIRSAADLLKLFFPLPPEKVRLHEVLILHFCGNLIVNDSTPPHRNPNFQNRISRWLAGSIGGYLCDKIPPLIELADNNNVPAHGWYQMASSLDSWFTSPEYQLNHTVSHYYHLSAIAVHSALCRLARSRYDLSTAIHEASYACARQRWHPDIPSSDGQHMYALTIQVKLDLIRLYDDRYHLMALLSNHDTFRNRPGSAMDRTIRRAGLISHLRQFPDDYTAPDHLAQGQDLLLRLDHEFFPWQGPLLAENYCIDEDSPVEFSPALVEAALRPVRDVRNSLRRMAQGEDLHDDPVFPFPDRETAELASIFQMMLDRYFLLYEAYRAKDFFGSRDLQFLCIQSLRCCALSIYSACAPGASGAALNHLGFALENQQCAADNNPLQPFFLRFPHRHLDIPGLDYDQPCVAAFRVYRRVYDIPRGLQPYSSRKLAELLLSRRVRLDEDGQPQPCTPETPFTQAEFDVLEEATLRSGTKRRLIAGYWRARYLHEKALALGGNTPEGSRLLEQAREMLAEDRAMEQKLHKSKTPYFALIEAEDLGLNYTQRPSGWAERLQWLSDFLQEQTDLLATPATLQRPCVEHLQLIRDCHRRLVRFGTFHAPELFRAYYTFQPPPEG